MKLRALLVAALVILAALSAAAADFVQPAPRLVVAFEKDAPFVPSETDAVDEMLSLARVGPGDVLYDLGCGDGRIVVAAAKLGARGVGIDIDPERIRESRRRAEAEEVAGKVRFIIQDMFEAEIDEATVVALYLLPSVNMRLLPKLITELKPGSRVVSNMFSLGNWEPDRNSGLVNCWIVPANITGEWSWRQAGTGEQMMLRLKQKFQQVKGDLIVGGTSYPLKRTRLSGPDLEFSVNATGGKAKAAKYKCRAAGDILFVTETTGPDIALAKRLENSRRDIQGRDW